jgi:hypothetical protein
MEEMMVASYVHRATNDYNMYISIERSQKVLRASILA